MTYLHYLGNVVITLLVGFLFAFLGLVFWSIWKLFKDL